MQTRGMDTTKRGAGYEQATKHYLQNQGLRPVACNYRCRHGEIDLVMREHKVLVFVEVRFRKHQQYGGGAASVDSSKQRKLSLAAAHYIQQHGYKGDCRFDVVDVSHAATSQKKNRLFDFLTAAKSSNLSFNWIKNAFYTT